MSRTDLKICSGCSMALYCDAVCQWKQWPTHKEFCIPYDKIDILAMDLCNCLFDHAYIRLHLVLYAMRSIGTLHHSPLPYLSVLSHTFYEEKRLKVRDALDASDVYAILVTPFRKEDYKDRTARIIYSIDCVVPNFVAKIKQTATFPKEMGFESHSFGVIWKLTGDLDELYW
ncbi:MYND-type domain-containing protein [Mycena sanguinolenta]|uniref:MYND-type domain-containing protein n=1 Tax=Mycena sanguinolenta TaxID=230812 RepID=A0A8H7D2Z0_9AGAR|nr:MYND-type domain-containing protein [Mycena sanguinolenta]